MWSLLATDFNSFIFSENPLPWRVMSAFLSVWSPCSSKLRPWWLWPLDQDGLGTGSSLVERALLQF